MERSRIVIASLMVCACTAAPSPKVSEPAERPSVAALPVVPQEEPQRPTVIEGTIVGESPIGDGNCTQKSYEVETAAERTWVHFEHCGAGPELPFAGFEVGQRVRFTVEYGASANFGDGPMILDAEIL